MKEKTITMNLSEYECFEADKLNLKEMIKDNMVCERDSWPSLRNGISTHVTWFDIGERLKDKEEIITRLEKKILFFKSLSVKQFKDYLKSNK